MTDQKTAVTFDKPVTGFMKTGDILKALDLYDAYLDAVVKLCDVRGMKQDAAGVAFVESKYTDLTDYLNTYEPGKLTLEELRPIIQEWIAKQAAEVVMG
jgi:hypothetical protein